MIFPLASLGNLMGTDGLLIFLALLLLFGAKKLPELARGLGQSLNEFKKAREDVEHEIRAGQQDVQAREAANRQPYNPAPPAQSLTYSNPGTISTQEAELQRQVEELQARLRVAEEQNKHTPTSVS